MGLPRGHAVLPTEVCPAKPGRRGYPVVIPAQAGIHLTVRVSQTTHGSRIKSGMTVCQARRWVPGQARDDGVLSGNRGGA